MQDFNYLKLFKTWLISLSVYIVLMFMYLMISGRVIGEMYGGDIVLNLSMVVVFLSGITGLFCIGYAAAKKVQNYIFVGLGILALDFILFAFVVVLAISQIW